MRKMIGLTRVFCLALGLTVAAGTTVNAGIDKSTVEAGRVHIQGKIDSSQDLVVRSDRGDRPMEWRSSRAGGGDFEVVVEASDKIRLEGGKTGQGFVVTTKVLTSSDITYVACGGDLAGTFAIRREADLVTKDGVLTFADVTLKDGTKLPVSLHLALTRDEQAARQPGQETEKRTILRPIWLLVDAKTQEKIQAGNRGINNFKRPDVPKRIEIPKESVAKTTLRDAKQKRDQNSERFAASARTLATYNRDFVVKSVRMTLADGTLVECRALVRMEDAQEVVLEKDIIMALAIETDSDQGPETWYCYVSVYEASVAPPTDPTTQKKDMERLQGTWHITSSQHTAETFLFEEAPKGLKVVVMDDTLTYYSRDEQGRYEGRVQLDAVTKALDWSPAYSGIGPSGATVPFRGIYELKGDELKIYFHETKWERPKTFDFKEGWLLVLKRNAKDKVPEDKAKEADDKTVNFINKVVWLLVLKGSAFDKVPEGKVKAPDDNEKAPEDNAVDAITALGGTITRDEQLAEKPVIGVSFANTGITNEELKVLKELKHLQSLNLHRCYVITDAALPEIAELKSLRSLDLGFTGLQTDTAINEGHLGESIFVTLVFRMGLGIPRRDCTGITDQGFPHLKQLENLQSLNLNGTQITDAGLAELKTLKNLQSLVIGYNEKITGTGLAEFKDLKNLQHLDLIHSDITDEGAECLAKLQSLKTIDLRGSKITDAGLKELQSLHNLKELNLCLVPGGPFDVTREGIKELQEALPEANILR